MDECILFFQYHWIEDLGDTKAFVQALRIILWLDGIDRSFLWGSHSCQGACSIVSPVAEVRPVPSIAAVATHWAVVSNAPPSCSTSWGGHTGYNRLSGVSHAQRSREELFIVLAVLAGGTHCPRSSCVLCSFSGMGRSPSARAIWVYDTVALGK